MRILCISPKNTYAAKRLKDEARKKGSDFEIISPKDLLTKKIDPRKYDLLYIRFAHPNFPGVISLAKEFKKFKKPVVDSEWIFSSMDVSKYTMYKKLSKQGIPIPKTDYLSLSSNNFPKVIKWVYGFGGKHVWLVKNKKQLEDVLKKYPRKQLIEQEFLNAEYEYKVITIGYKSLPEIIRYKIDPVRKFSDLNQFKIFKREQVKKVVSLAEKSSRIVGRELAKVDIIESNKKLYVLEVNRSPGLEPNEKATKENIFEKFIAYLEKKVNNNLK